MREAVDEAAARTGFSGVVHVHRGDQADLVRAYGLADRGHGVPNTIETRFGLASGAKGLTALTVMSLVDEGALELDTTARSVLGADLPLIAGDVTVEHLLAHRSGIGDYLDEDAHEVTDYVMPVPVHALATTEEYLAVLDGHPTVCPAGERFAYCNGGYVVLALIAERAGGLPFPDLVARRVCEPAGMASTSYLRSDELPGDAALGYLSAGGPRSNILHLPVRGSGDGGVYSTAADVGALWQAAFAGRVVPADRFAEMLRPRSSDPGERMRYGLGFWLHESRDLVSLTGYDAGVSFRSVHDPASDTTQTVISNWTDGAWPMAELLDALLGM